MNAPERRLAEGAGPPLLYLGLSAAYSWPLARLPDHVLSSRADIYPLLWLASAAQRLDGGLHTALAAWPQGQSLAGVDSLLYLALATLLGPLLRPTTLAWTLALLGPALSAWAAERAAARGLGVPLPWSLLAGLAYGFSGAMGNALLQGQLYHLLSPWLPLLAWALLRLEQPGARLRHGLGAGLAWSACLLTSAYLGLVASLLLLVLGLHPFLRARDRRPWLAAALAALPAATFLLATFAWNAPLREVRVHHSLSPAFLASFGSWHPLLSLGWVPSLPGDHAFQAPVGWLALALALAAPRVLPPGPWRRLLLAALLGAVLALGPVLSAGNSPASGLPGPLAPLYHLDFARYLRFPGRFLWLADLGLGLVAAQVAAELARRAPRRALLLLPAGLIELLRLSPPGLAPAPLELPSAYRALPPGPVFELLPEFSATASDLDLYVQNLSCAYQAWHSQPLIHPCIDTSLAFGPPSPGSDALFAALLDDARWERLRDHPETAASWLGGARSLVLRPLLLGRADRELVRARLDALFGHPLAESTDGGEWLVAYALPATRGGGR